MSEPCACDYCGELIEFYGCRVHGTDCCEEDEQ